MPYTLNGVKKRYITVYGIGRHVITESIRNPRGLKSFLCSSFCRQMTSLGIHYIQHNTYDMHIQYNTQQDKQNHDIIA